MIDPTSFQRHPYAEFLARVDKPARYTGGEVGTVVKDWATVEARVCLAFPDVYDIGMSHLGFKILYKILNDDPRTLAERCYAPWVDLEAELATRKLPLVSLESARPLRDFDVVGFSLQFELTYTNVLTMLHLGGIPLRASDRGEDDPLVIAGGPVATHPEAIAPFLDAVVIGDGEAKATEVALTWTRLRREGKTRAERLIALAKLGAVYVPALYDTAIEEATGLGVVTGPRVAGLPFPIPRALVNLNDYPFPEQSPTGGPEAIFDRMSIEIARGCTEGCRFCQAGMIYRPIRERDPEQIVETVVRAVKASGQDEVSLTALSTADVSCISPLIKKIVERLTPERVALGVSSLRAYGIDPDLLDNLRQVRATGLTFAPEAGTQRMRNVVNKNVTEDQLLETAERVFSRGWGKMKLYFMIGLPTETDDDVRGIVETGARTARVGRRVARGRADVTVSVSTHVPKPHTPFQFAAMDSLDEIDRKQRILRDTARSERSIKLRTHRPNASVLEGVFARGDRALADVLERAWRSGARFDSWDEKLRLDLWEEAFTHFGIDRARYLSTLPTFARLPWSHIDVGLEDGFLAREYRKALGSRLSPPCCKVAGTFVHHTNLKDAESDRRRLVCYDCGVACDMTTIRSRRIDFLDRMDAKERSPIALIEHDEPAVVRGPREGGSGKPPTAPRYRFRFEKIGPVALLGHLDLVREIPRSFRRAGIALTYTSGFHPKPDMTFAPALSLGVMSLDEFVDMRIEADLDPAALSALIERMNVTAPSGLVFRDAVRLGAEDASISKIIDGARYVLAFAKHALEGAAKADPTREFTRRCAEAMSAEALPIVREIDGVRKIVDARAYLTRATVGGADAAQLIARAGLIGDLALLDVDVTILGSGAVKTSELAAVLAGDGQIAPPHRAVRVELFGHQGGVRCSPLDLERMRKPRSQTQPLEAISS
jgi:radical SAM family uncharacterized protein/radical SAM-linked protein